MIKSGLDRCCQVEVSQKALAHGCLCKPGDGLVTAQLHEYPTIPEMGHCPNPEFARVMAVLQGLVKLAFEGGSGVAGEWDLSSGMVAFEVHEDLTGPDPFSGFEPGREVWERGGVGRA